MAKKKATIMRYFSIILLTGPIQNGGPAVSMVLKTWAAMATHVHGSPAVSMVLDTVYYLCI